MYNFSRGLKGLKRCLGTAEEGEVITEASPLEGEPWDYPRSKIETERLIRQERGNIPAVILRIAGVYNEDVHTVPIAQQISRIYEKRLESYFFPGDASHGEAFVHLVDLIDCFRKVVALRDELEGYQVFLIAEPDVMSYAELQDQLGQLIHGREWPTIRVPKSAAKAGAWVNSTIGGEEETFIKPWMIDLADDHYPIEVALQALACLQECVPDHYCLDHPSSNPVVAMAAHQPH